MWALAANQVIEGIWLSTLAGRCDCARSASKRPTAHALELSSDRTRFISSSLPVTLSTPVWGLFPVLCRSIADLMRLGLPIAARPGSMNDSDRLCRRKLRPAVGLSWLSGLFG